MPKAANKPWPKKIRDLRAALGMKRQADLARALGVTQPTVSDWERGIYSPSPEFYLKLGNLAAERSLPEAKWFFEQSGLAPAAGRETAALSDLWDAQRALEEWQQILAREEDARRVSQQAIVGLEAKLEECLVPAHRKGNKGAQRKLKRITDQLEDARREEKGHAAAASIAQGKVPSLQAEVEIAERRTERERLRVLIESITGQRERRIIDLWHQVEQELSDLLAAYKDIDQRMRAFSPRFSHSISQSVSRAAASADVVFPVYRKNKELENLSTVAQRERDGLLEALDALPLEGESPRGDLRLYEFILKLSGLKGLRCGVGERILLSPTEAAEWVEKGYLREVAPQDRRKGEL